MGLNNEIRVLGSLKLTISIEYVIIIKKYNKRAIVWNF